MRGRVALGLIIVGLVAATMSPSAPAAPRPAAPRPATPWTWRKVLVSQVPIEYAIAVPPGLVRGQAYNVLLAFPPGGQTRDLVETGLARYWAAEGIKRGWVVISPAAPRTGLFFQGSARLVAPFLDLAVSGAGITARNTAVGGISNGGLSAFRAALDRPDRYVALVTLPGALPSSSDATRLGGLKNMRVGLWVGANDAGWRESSQRIHDALAGISSVKVAVTLHVLPGQGHRLEGVDPAEVWDVIEGNAAPTPKT